MVVLNEFLFGRELIVDLDGQFLLSKFFFGVCFFCVDFIQFLAISLKFDHIYSRLLCQFKFLLDIILNEYNRIAVDDIEQAKVNDTQNCDDLKCTVGRGETVQNLLKLLVGFLAILNHGYDIREKSYL
jgi:hypothetical protein